MSFWDAFFLCLIYLPLVLVWAFSLFDIFDREDLTGARKAVWVAVVVLLPFVGTLVYLFTRRPGSRRNRQAATDAADRNAARFAPSSTAEQLSLLAELHDRGKLTDAEFAIEKERLLSRAAAAR
jgi:uncharacterized protein YpmS